MEDNYIESKKFFDKLSLTWDENQKYTQEEIEEFLSFLPIKKGDKVLDVGCGTGVISNILQKKSEDSVLAIDLSSNMIELAKNKCSNDNIIFKCMNIYDLNDSLFDCIVIFNAYPHFVEINKLVLKLNELIKENGYLIIAHNMSRKELDNHHEGLSNNISRKLNAVEDEYKYFSSYFNAITLVDNDKCFKMVLKKK